MTAPMAGAPSPIHHALDGFSLQMDVRLKGPPEHQSHLPCCIRRGLDCETASFAVAWIALSAQTDRPRRKVQPCRCKEMGKKERMQYFEKKKKKNS